MTTPTSLPFAYNGKKSNAAKQIWELLGDPKHYIEPFAGSCAVLLGRPHDYTQRYETINDYDAYLTNLLRAIKLDPEKLFEHVDATPANRIEFAALYREVSTEEENLRERIEADRTYCDIDTAAQYYAMLCGSFPRSYFLKTATRTHVRLSYRDGLKQIFEQIAQRFRYACIQAASWETLVTNAQLSSPTGIYLDPPYDKTESIYRKGNQVSADVEAWCLEQTGGPHRIVLSGYDSEHDTLLDHGWEKVEARKATCPAGALGNNTNTEQLWYTPNCIDTTEETLF